MQLVFSASPKDIAYDCSGVNIIVINTVKHSFELLVRISPILALDAAFEAPTRFHRRSGGSLCVQSISRDDTQYHIIPYLPGDFQLGEAQCQLLQVNAVEPIIAKLFGKTNFSPPEHVKRKNIRLCRTRRTAAEGFPCAENTQI